MSQEPRIIRAYRRILENAEKGKGVRLSAEEVADIAAYDGAIFQAVDAYDHEDGGVYPVEEREPE